MISSFDFKKMLITKIFSPQSKKPQSEVNYKVIVTLTGGLGNQLFQLSAALAIADGAQVALDYSIGAPRTNSSGKPEISSFKLPENVTIFPLSTRSTFTTKASGYMLRIGVSPRKFEQSLIYRNFFAMLWNALMIISMKHFVISSAGVGVGYFELKKRKFKQFIYGYFQSYIWPERSLEVLCKMKPIGKSTLLDEFRVLAEVENPLIVHIRLGDYKLENNFGIPSKSYYSEAISQLWNSGNFKKIWVFSDEPELAAAFLPREYLSEIRWVPDIDQSPAHTLEAMRLGKGYVIGNSTFSWWGAFLAYTSNVQVIAPKPWFKLGESPRALIPPGWKQIDAFKD